MSGYLTDFSLQGDKEICSNCAIDIQKCICSDLSNIPSPHHFFILLHERERYKRSNTGHLLTQCLNCQYDVFVRKQPSDALYDFLQQHKGRVVLLYYSDQLVKDTGIWQQEPDQNMAFVLLDATWQLAHKMWKQSPMLQSIPLLPLKTDRPTEYRLRRNQKQRGYSTLEAAAAALRWCHDENASERLLQLQARFMDAYESN